MKTKWMLNLVGIVFLASSVSAYAEDWKGEPEKSELSVGGLAGMGIIDGTMGLALYGTISKKIIKHGFVPDISDSVSVELLGGPVILPGSTAFGYGATIRWDFYKDSQWTPYAFGGVGGNLLNSRFELLPRFGVGIFCNLAQFFRLRAEVGADLIAAGVNFLF